MITKEQFLAYERIRSEGRFNMIMDAPIVMKLIGVNQAQYCEILESYGELHDKYIGGLV